MNNSFDGLRQKIEKRTAGIAVIGLGYVGLPMCVEFSRAGFRVTGIDTHAGRVQMLHEGKSYVLDISEEVLRSVMPKFSATTDFQVLKNADVIVICVPTPLRKT